MFELNDLIRLHETVIPAFQEKWTNGSKNEARMLADNWDDSQKNIIEGQQRVPYTFPIASSYIQRIVAMQRQSRQGWKTQPKIDPRDEIKAELAGMLLRNYEQENDMPELESQVFYDGLALSYGVDKFVIDTDTGQITNKQIDYRNVVWDINSQSDDLSDALFVCEIERVYRKELPEEFQTSPDVSNMGRELQSYFVYESNEDKGYDLVSVFHHFQKVQKQFYVVYVKDSHDILELPDVKIKFRKKKDAEEFIQNIEDAYRALYSLDPTGETELRTEKHYVWDYYKFTYTGIMEHKELDWKHHPYNVYRSVRVKNDWISMLDFMSSPQLLLDRIVSQIDFSLKKELKQVYELNIAMLAEGETPASATKKMSKTGGVIYKRGGEKVISESSSNGINPQYLQIVGLTNEFLSELVGGKNLLGSQESAQESGKAVALRQQQGKLVAYLFLSELERYKRKKGEKLLYFIQKYDTAERVLKIEGSNLQPELKQALTQVGAYQQAQLHSNLAFVKVNFNELTMLKNADLEVQVDTAPLTETERGFRMAMMNDAERTAPMLTQSITWQLEKLKYLDIDPVVRQKIVQELTGNIQAEQQQAQEKINIQKERNDIKKSEVLLNSLGNNGGSNANQVQKQSA